MSWDWNDRDLSEWAKKTLPEFLMISLQDPSDKTISIARTPWESFECQVGEVHVVGEANLMGKKTHALFQFDVSIGLRVDIEKKDTPKSSAIGVEEAEGVLFWTCIAQIAHFENCNMQPQVVAVFEEVPQFVSDEVGWYLNEGMGKYYIWHGLARWHAYAVKKWMKVDPPAIRDPYRYPVAPPASPPFKEGEQMPRDEHPKRELGGKLDDPRGGPGFQQGMAALQTPQFTSGPGGQPFIGRKEVMAEEEAQESSDGSDEDEEYDPTASYEYDECTCQWKRQGAPPKMGRLTRYPFLPSMLCGVGGPSTSWLGRGGQPIGCSPERLHDGLLAKRKAGITHVDVVLEQARQRRDTLEAQPEGQLAARASELCDAIEKGQVMRAFAKLDEETANVPHPRTGRCAAHYCVARDSKELLQLVIDAKANVNAKDALGQTPLMAAAKQGSEGLVRLLLDAGADAAEEDTLGRSAGDMVKVLPITPDGPLKNWRAKLSGEPIPQDPAKKSHELKELIAEKERPKKYGLMLLSSVGQRDARTAEASIDSGADVTLKDAKGDTALLLLAKANWKDQEEIQVRLAEKARRAGADLNFRNCQGNTPLLFAAHRGNRQLVECLLRLRADASMANEEGNTALMYAAHSGHEVICLALLEAFAPAKVRNKSGLTAADMAQKRGFKSCAILVQAYEMAPKKSGTQEVSAPKKKEKQEHAKLAFDYSKWNALEKEMAQDEELEEDQRRKEEAALIKRPAPRMEDMGPEAFGLPPDTPWPPGNPTSRLKGPFDYSRWDKVVDDIERRDKAVERYERLQKSPEYEWRDGQKMQVIF